MNFLDNMGTKDAPRPIDAEVKLELFGLEKPDALKKLETIVAYCKRSKASTLYVGFDPAKPGGGETLFQPVARFFKIEILNKYVSHAVPIMTGETAGLFVTFRP